MKITGKNPSKLSIPGTGRVAKRVATFRTSLQHGTPILGFWLAVATGGHQGIRTPTLTVVILYLWFYHHQGVLVLRHLNRKTTMTYSWLFGQLDYHLKEVEWNNLHPVTIILQILALNWCFQGQVILVMLALTLLHRATAEIVQECWIWKFPAWCHSICQHISMQTTSTFESAKMFHNNNPGPLPLLKIVSH